MAVQFFIALWIFLVFLTRLFCFPTLAQLHGQLCSIHKVKIFLLVMMNETDVKGCILRASYDVSLTLTRL